MLFRSLGNPVWVCSWQTLPASVIAKLQNLPDEGHAERYRLEAQLQGFQAQEPQRAERLTVINRLHPACL